MKITWLGHACFKIEKDGFAVILDPYADGSVPGLGNIREEADLVLCSHSHHDHNAVECVKVREGAVNPFTITILDSFHDEVKGAKRGPNKITILDDGCSKTAHLGDLGCDLTSEQIEILKGVDVVLIPVGGFFTIDGAQAAKTVSELEPKTVIPMHYQNQEAGFGYEVIGKVSAFTDCMDSVAVSGTSSVDTEETYDAQVLVLTPAML